MGGESGRDLAALDLSGAQAQLRAQEARGDEILLSYQQIVLRAT